MTSSVITRMPRAWASCSRRRKSSRVPKAGLTVGVVGDVVAAVAHGRGVKRQQPDGGDAEVAEVVELADEAREVPDAVGVRVGEGADRDLVDHRLAVPVRVRLDGAVVARGSARERTGLESSAKVKRASEAQPAQWRLLCVRGLAKSTSAARPGSPCAPSAGSHLARACRTLWGGLGGRAGGQPAGRLGAAGAGHRPAAADGPRRQLPGLARGGRGAGVALFGGGGALPRLRARAGVHRRAARAPGQDLPLQPVPVRRHAVRALDLVHRPGRAGRGGERWQGTSCPPSCWGGSPPVARGRPARVAHRYAWQAQEEALRGGLRRAARRGAGTRGCWPSRPPSPPRTADWLAADGRVRGAHPPLRQRRLAARGRPQPGPAAPAPREEVIARAQRVRPARGPHPAPASCGRGRQAWGSSSTATCRWAPRCAICGSTARSS